ncbi:MAG: efflux RND transporter periplasmic adaptor subunit [Planctomycetes bacterium]|nr:efflux RND transporter periplasmic adaptor subunit [Planctomycetota bacterium]
MNEREPRFVAREAGRVHGPTVLLCAVVVGVAALLWRVVPQRAASESLAEHASESSTTYYCPMHPTYTSDRPGDCPICNMKLVPIGSGDSTSESKVEGRAVIALDEGRRQLIGVRIGSVERQRLEQNLRAVGRVEYDERLRSAVNLKVGGWIEELFVESTGETVRAGDPLFSLYSPELMEAQRNYLLAFASKARNAAATSGPSVADTTLRASRERLALLDQAPERIAELEASGEVPRTTTFYAKTDGVVLERNVLRGGRVEAGTNLYALADVSKVWVLAEFYEYELSSVRVGQPAWIQLSSLPGEPIQGAVAYIYPYLERESRTASVRIEVANSDGRLKPGMFATVFVSADLGEQLVIDDQAVLETGERQLVFVDLGDGHLEPREVELGAQVGERRIVLGGLTEGERVVVSGNFLVDSESRLKSALANGMGPSAGEVQGSGASAGPAGHAEHAK